MPTQEEIDQFKRAFKATATKKNSKIRWDAPTGALKFMKTQTSLAEIVSKLDVLREDPSLESIELVRSEIDKLSKDKTKKYAEAIEELLRSLAEAASSLEEEDSPSVGRDVPQLERAVGRRQVFDSPFDLSVEPSKSVIETFVDNLGGLAQWKQEQEKNSLAPLEDEHTTMVFKKDALDQYSTELKYITGTVPTTEDDATCVGQTLEDLPKNERVLVGVSLEVITDVRSKLTKGPFNNYLGLPKEITDTHLIPDELISSKLEAECGSMSLPNLKNHVLQMFKLEGETIEATLQNIDQLEDWLEDNEGHEDFEKWSAALAEQKEKLAKLRRVEALTGVDDVGEWLKETPSPGWWNSVVETASNIAAEQAREAYPSIADKKIQMASLGRATLEVGGGVCSKMAMATHGELTTKLPPGSEIAQVFHNFDHEFVAARVPGGRWFVVDPWPHNPVVVPFVDSYFKPEDVEHFVITKVTETCEHPYGVDLDTGFDWGAILTKAKEDTPLGSVEMKGTYGHSSACEKDVDPRLKGTSSWG